MKNIIKFFPLLLILIFTGFGCASNIDNSTADIGNESIDDNLIENDDITYIMSSANAMFTTPSRFIVSQSDTSSVSLVSISGVDQDDRIVIIIQRPYDWESDENFNYQNWLTDNDLDIYKSNPKENIGGFNLDLNYPIDTSSTFYDSFNDPSVYTGVINPEQNIIVRIIVDSPVSNDMQEIIDSIILMPTEDQIGDSVII